MVQPCFQHKKKYSQGQVHASRSRHDLRWKLASGESDESPSGVNKCLPFSLKHLLVTQMLKDLHSAVCIGAKDFAGAHKGCLRRVESCPLTDYAHNPSAELSAHVREETRADRARVGDIFAHL